MKTTEGKNVCLFLIERLIHRLSKFETRTVTRVATLLDARFKKEGFRSANNAGIALGILENELITVYKSASTLHERAKPPTPPNLSQPQPKFKFLQQKIYSRVHTTRSDAITVLRQYFERPHAPQDIDPLEYWKTIGNEMELLKSCAMRYFCIPATSTESERMFSKAGYIISDRRSCLKEKNVNMLLFLNKNNWLM
ncbi:PREDICTED: uncharacterized protein LOC108367370 [Rhagoletis zephyria]|uniref:uncharacterized protein LOC108367370 n=1 Tax=Rhagoletis zephyria TaxID=28612 RepID=UPI0008113E3E|nr:PREDICTED: uncharacterized protein LOC108367370 [Rhagoletis zephyria]